MMELLAQHAADDAVAFAGEGERTRLDLTVCVHAIAAQLTSLTVGTHVVLACSDRYYFAASLLAAWSLGLRVALPPNGQDDTVHSLVRTVGAGALLHDRDGGVGIDVRKIAAETEGPDTLRLNVRRDDVAVIAFTSGSTGEPQAHEKTFAQLLDETACLIAHFSLSRARVLSAVPPHHIYGLLFGVIVPLCAGGAMSRISPLLPSDLLSCAARERADVLVAVPPHLRALSQDAGWPDHPFRRVFSSGGPLPDDVASALSGRGMTVTQVLGSTETGGIAYRESHAMPWHPLPSVEISVGADCALHVASPWLSAKVAQPMATQDRIRLVDGGFEHLGRLDAVVKVGGRRVDLGDLESKLRSAQGVRDARVLAEEGDSVRGCTLLAVVEGDDLTVEALRAHLTVSVDPVVVPRRFRIVRSLPRNEAGKVTHEALRALFDTWTFPRREDEGGLVHFRVPSHLGFFRGHFDGDPILPGVVQLQRLALREARLRWPELGAVVRLSRVKFKRPIRPGEELVLSLSRKRPELVEMSLRCGDEVASSGLLHFGSPEMSGATHG